MSKPTFDINSEAYQQYQWMVSVIEPYTDGLSVDTTDEDSDVETSTTITLEKKMSGKSFIIMKTEDTEITIHWDGTRLSATIFNEETQDSDKLEVPDAITSIMDVLKDVFGITKEESTVEEDTTCNEDEDIEDDLSNDPEDDKPIEDTVEEEMDIEDDT